MNTTRAQPPCHEPTDAGYTTPGSGPQPRTRALRAVDTYRHDHPSYLGWIVWGTIIAIGCTIWLVAIIAAIGLFT